MKDEKKTKAQLIKELEDLRRKVVELENSEIVPKRAEEASCQDEQRYYSLFNNLLDGFAYCKMLFDDHERPIDFVYLKVNNAFIELTGLKGVVGKKVTEVIPGIKASNPEMFEIYGRVALTGNPERFELYLKSLEAWLSISVYSTRKGYFVTMAEDITRRKEAEESLTQEKETLFSILESNPCGIAVVGRNGVYQYVNPEFTKITGYTLVDIKTGRDWFQKAFPDPKYRKKVIETWKKNTEKEGKSIDEGFIITCKDGSRKDIEFRSMLLKDFSITVMNDITERKQMEERLRQSEERYRNIIEQMEEGYFEVDLAGKFTFVNDAECRSLGYSREELIGMSNRQCADEKNAKALYRLFNEIYKTGKSVKAYEYKLIKKDGTKCYNEISASLIRNSKGEPIGFRGIARDVTERKQMEERLRQSEERYRNIIEQMEEGYFEVDLAGKFTFINDAECRNLGYSREELIGRDRRLYADGKNADALYRYFIEVYKTGKSVKAYEFEIIKKDGTKFYEEISASLIRNSKGDPIGFRGIARDVTERKQAEKQIQYLATHDGLTGLPNRMMFSQLLNHAIQSARRFKRQFAIFFIDLDRFKNINDTLGHEAGDLLLQEIAVRLKQVLREIDLVARLGGDEFVTLIQEVQGSSQVSQVAGKILSAIIKPITLMGQECRITASVGICLYPEDGQDEPSLMKNADIAMYLAKEEGKNNYQFYSRTIKSQSIERLTLETNLRRALERNEFSLNYQAKLDFKTGAITGVEALLRWQNPELGAVSPTKLIPVAEETGLIVPIGRWILKTACAQNVAWQSQGLPAICMAVNLSILQLMDDNLLNDITTALKDSGMAPNLLELEVTECVLLQNSERVIGILTAIKSMGVRLAIDNFGTGYSSLTQISRYPIDTIKVDRSFIHDIPGHIEDKEITKAIIAMGKTLSLTVVAQGVETLEQDAFLREQACDEMQGYYFSKPLSSEEFSDLLHRHVPPTRYHLLGTDTIHRESLL